MKIQPLQPKVSCFKYKKNCEYKNSYTQKTLNFSEDHFENYFYAPVNISFGKSKEIESVANEFKDKIKIIFSDVDGTISPYFDMVSEKTISSIENLHSRNVPVILTTARSYKDTLPIIEQFGHSPDYTIALQGGSVIDKEGNVILENEISQKTGKNLLKWFEEYSKRNKNLRLILYFNDEAYSLSSYKFPWKPRCQVNQIDSFDNFFKRNESLQKAVLVDTNVQEGNSDRIISDFLKSGLSDLCIKSSGRGFYELQDKSVSKDKAIDFILKKLDINPEQAAAIGDSSNDIEMLEFIRRNNGLAVAMGNASESVKKHANAVTSDIKEDGFCKLIENIFS